MRQPLYIPLETWNTLSWKEQDFIVMLRESRFTKAQIMRRLYITTEVWYWKLRERVRKRILGDSRINAVNEISEPVCVRTKSDYPRNDIT